MQTGLQTHIAFHLSGMRGRELDAIDSLGLRPVLLAGYRDLGRLRYDFPLVLIRDGAGEASVQSLSSLIDGALKEIAVGVDGERLRKQAFRFEREIRAVLAERSRGSLSALWEAAASRLYAANDPSSSSEAVGQAKSLPSSSEAIGQAKSLPSSSEAAGQAKSLPSSSEAAGQQDLLRDSLTRLRAAIKCDGEAVDCDLAMPFRLCHHAWRKVLGQKTRRFREDIGRLVMKLADILRADFVHSPEGLSAEKLKASVGTAHHDAFDFDALSRLLTRTASKVSLSESRRRRIRWLLTVLESQRFFPPLTEAEEHHDPFGFVFESCADAVGAYRERLPKMVDLTQAIAMAGLEIAGEYDELRHDPFFANYGVDNLDPRDFDLFPDYLICMHASDMRAADTETILEAFSAGMRAKVIVQTDDLLEPSSIAGGNLALGLRSRQLANTAIGLSGFYVLQSPSSNLLQFKERIFRGFAYPGPALFSIFSGATGNDLPPYLNAAAAMESRAFPAFTYDPSAGPDWATRFYLDANPQAECDWPSYGFAYENGEHQRIAETVAFTLLDFAACDQRYFKHFASVPQTKWNENLAPASEFLAPGQSGTSDKVPCLLMVDSANVLHKVIVDDKLVRGARRCVEMWRSLQELGGIHSSHAARALAQERKVWEQAQQETAPRVNGHAAAPVPPVSQGQGPAAAQEAEPERSSADPYIETARCTSCNECTRMNDKMFAYDANKQAYIKDPDAGTYRQLVEAAENCQLSIVHPGQPRNPDEAGLDELIKRAEPFM